MKKIFLSNNKSFFLIKRIFICLIILLSVLLLIYLFDKYNFYSQNFISDKLNSKDKKENYTSYSQIELNHSEWSISIPKIGLYNVKISEGVDSDILNKYVGHFENTSKEYGNIGLAAHNRGYAVNYFSNIHKLEYGDSIFYNYYGIVKEYSVILKEEIDSYDWSYLESTNDDRITLITCIDNMPNLRLCIQAVIKEE